MKLAVMPAPFDPPDQGPRFAGFLRSTPVLWKFGCRLHPRIVPAARPAAAKASDRTGRYRGPIRASVTKGESHDYRQLQIRRRPGHFTGELATLTVGGPQGGVPAKRSEGRQGAKLPRLQSEQVRQCRPRRCEEEAPRKAGITSRSSSTIRASLSGEQSPAMADRGHADVIWSSTINCGSTSLSTSLSRKAGA